MFDSRTGQRVDKIHNKSPHSCDLQLPTGVTSDSNGYIFFTDANNFFCNHFIQVGINLKIRTDVNVTKSTTVAEISSSLSSIIRISKQNDRVLRELTNHK